jgi:hypothetical protein
MVDELLVVLLLSLCSDIGLDRGVVGGYSSWRIEEVSADVHFPDGIAEEGEGNGIVVFTRGLAIERWRWGKNSVGSCYWWSVFLV